jgi:hypothetical protein
VNFINGDAHFLRELSLRFRFMRHEFVKRGIEQADGGRKTFEGLEDAGEVFALIRQQLGERFFAVGDVVARIISRTASMRSPSKNMCSVRVRPMP